MSAFLSHLLFQSPFPLPSSSTAQGVVWIQSCNPESRTPAWCCHLLLRQEKTPLFPGQILNSCFIFMNKNTGTYMSGQGHCVYLWDTEQKDESRPQDQGQAIVLTEGRVLKMGSHPNLTKVLLLGNCGLKVSLKLGGRTGAKEMDRKEAFIFPYLTLQHWMFLNLTKNYRVSELFLCPMLTTNLLQICCSYILKYQVCFLLFHFVPPRIITQRSSSQGREKQSYPF